jgi:hypothetical protein
VQVAANAHHAVVFRVQAGHISRWTKQPLPSGTDLDVAWQPSPNDKVQEDIAAPSIQGRLIYQRIEFPGFQPIDLYLFTTLIDRQQFPMQAILELYARRWNVELDLRHIKTTLDMERLTAKSVDMVRKELSFGLVAYNLICDWMSRAALQAHISPLRLSLASCWRRIVDTCRSFHSDLSETLRLQILDDLLLRLATCLLPVRKKLRIEPRAVWGHSQPFPYIKGSRQEARNARLLEIQKS